MKKRNLLFKGNFLKVVKPFFLLLTVLLFFVNFGFALVFRDTIAINSHPDVKQHKVYYWPNNARLVISISMQFEAGGQTENAESPFSGMPLSNGQTDFVANSWFNYGAKEGIYRMLGLWKAHNIKVTSHIVGVAAERYPKLVKTIAEEGHEIAGHGMFWKSQWNMPYDDEIKHIKDNVEILKKITGQNVLGYNCHWMRRSNNTLNILRDLGFVYHIDDLSRDEPFFTKVRDTNFIVIPYTIRNNDIATIEGKNWSPDQFLAQLKKEFDQLYQEGATKRRMMSISLHDRIGGMPSMVKVLDEFINYAKKQKGVVFMKKIDIAKLIQNDLETPVDTDNE